MVRLSHPLYMQSHPRLIQVFLATFDAIQPAPTRPVPSGSTELVLVAEPTTVTSARVSRAGGLFVAAYSDIALLFCCVGIIVSDRTGLGFGYLFCLVLADCPVGRYRSISDNNKTLPTECTKCAAGRYGSRSGLTSPSLCSICPAGRYYSMPIHPLSISVQKQQPNLNKPNVNRTCPASI